MIAIVEYGVGNVGSVRNAVRRLGYESIVTNDIAAICKADKVILPGVGEAGFAMRSLTEAGLDKIIPCLTQPLLGICLGMQLLCNKSMEGNTRCLGMFDVEVMKFPSGHIVPHMGWNNMKNISSGIFDGVGNSSDVYFVHSYYVPVCEYTIAESSYILPFSAAIQKQNFYATQFHPEKSAGVGEIVLKNFLAI